MRNAVPKTENTQKTLDEIVLENQLLKKELDDLRAVLETKEKDLKDTKEDLMATKADLDIIREKFRRAQKKLFGSNSEHIARDGGLYEQLSFVFNEAELINDTEPAETETVEVKGHKRKKKVVRSGSIDDIIPEDAPVEVIEYRPDDITCPQCGTEMVEIGKEVRKTLILVRKHYKVREERFYKYACKVCDSEGTETPVVEADRPPSLIDGSFASPEAVAELIYEKFIMYSPLYRQEQDWGRLGLKLSRQTMSNWILHCAQHYLRPVYEELRQLLLKAEIVHADETELQVLHEPDRRPKSKSYMWLYMTGRYEPRQIVLYNYNESRKGSVPKAFLGDYSGYLQTDGYAGYNILSDTTRIGCLAHARRKFTDALNGMKEKDRKGSVAAEALAKIERILLKEKELVNLSPEERLEQRLSGIKPLMDDLLAWADSICVIHAKTKEGITYLKNQRATFNPFFSDGRIELTNNRAERSIKPFVIYPSILVIRGNCRKSA